ncbi:MAG: hypothetical protein JO242_23780, partial [Streptosporangiaceae bacterium]|nr:hypothetical protein [Streptosporangiaceae bacterium]
MIPSNRTRRRLAWPRGRAGLLAAAAPLIAGSTKAHGYVTAVTSATTFEIDDYRVT